MHEPEPAGVAPRAQRSLFGCDHVGHDAAWLRTGRRRRGCAEVGAQRLPERRHVRAERLTAAERSDRRFQLPRGAAQASVPANRAVWNSFERITRLLRWKLSDPANVSESQMPRSRRYLGFRPSGRLVSRVSAPKPVDVVRGYNQALGALDVGAMLAFVHEDCEIVSPRGIMRGHESVRAFAARQSYGVRMVPAEQRYFARGEKVVLHGVVEWRYVDSDELAGRDDGVTVWTVRDGRIARLEIHEELESALASAGLTRADEVSDA